MTGVAPTPRTRVVPPDHFSTGVWRASGPLALRHYTCVRCDMRLFSLDQFRDHVRRCRGIRMNDLPTPARARGGVGL